MSAISMGASSPGSASAWSSIGEAAMVAVERAEAATEWRAGAAMVEVEGSAAAAAFHHQTLGALDRDLGDGHTTHIALS